MATRYYITLPDGRRARGSDPDLSFTAQSGPGFAAELQDALRSDRLFERWRMKQDEPDEVDPSLGATDPTATVHGEQAQALLEDGAGDGRGHDQVDVQVVLLAGSAWELRDVTAA